LSAVTLLLLTASAHPAPPPAENPLCGRQSLHHGILVLEVWGSPQQAGYAQGYLLAERIMGLFEEAVLDPRVGATQEVYENILLPASRRQFIWSERFEQELNGILRGVRDRLGASGARSPKLNRALTIDDLKLVNLLSDWRGTLCSSFSAWGQRTRDGQTLTARNLDYFHTPGVRRGQIVLIHRGEANAQPWISITWPGFIGVYTAMNADGVTLSLHDAAGLAPSDPTRLVPRSLALRAALEAAAGQSAIEDVRRVLRKSPVLVGANIHVSTPFTPGRPAAAVFEHDGNNRDKHLAMRLPDDNQTSPAQTLCCTNHMRKRRAASDCSRYQTLTAHLAARASAQTPLDAAAALHAIGLVARDTTLHTVVFLPDRRTLLVVVPGVHERPVTFDLNQWLQRPLESPDDAPAPARTRP
jgi:hypothetical protein